MKKCYMHKILFMEKAWFRLIRSYLIHCNHCTNGLPISPPFLPKSISNLIKRSVFLNHQSFCFIQENCNMPKNVSYCLTPQILIPKNLVQCTFWAHLPQLLQVILGPNELAYALNMASPWLISHDIFSNIMITSPLISSCQNCSHS